MSACLTEDTLFAYLEGQLGDEESERLLAHTDVCTSCFTLLAEAARTYLSASPASPSGSRVPDESAGHWRPPDVVDEYRLLRPIGRGAVGQVYLAIDTQLDRAVALKFLAVEAHASTRERFRLEARAVARLQHPNVVTLYRVGEVAGRPFLVSAFVRGRNLSHLAKPTPWRDALDIGLQLARGVAAAHRAGVLHRDIKPANVIVAEDGAVTVLDFGLAKLMESGGQHLPHVSIDETVSAALDISPSLTATGALLGTPLYMAPEAWRAEPSTAQMDVYSLGAVLYELCVGAPPHGGANVPEIRRKVLSEDVSLAETEVHPELGGIIERCLRREPSARFHSAVELAAALESLHARLPRAALPRPRRRRHWLSAATFVAVLLASTAATLRLKSQTIQRKQPSAQKCSADGWCWDASWTGRLEGVWGSARDDAWAVGERGAILHWDGQRWSRVESGSVADLYAVRGSARDDVWATGDWGTILHWDGRSWSQRPSGTTALLADVWSFDGKDAWAVGLDGGTLHWNGVTWKAVPSGTVNGLYRVAATAPDDVWAVGQAGTILHWDGKRWATSLVTGPSDEILMGLHCFGRNDVWVGGRHAGKLLHWDGTRWAKVPVPDIVPTSERDDYWFSAIWGTSARDLWLLPKRRPPLHWDGTKWTEHKSSVAAELYRFWGSGADDIWATGDLGILVHWDGQTWSPPTPPIPYVGYYAIWASSSANVWLAGWGNDRRGPGYAIAARWDGAQLTPIPVSGVPILHALWGSGGDDVWAAGGEGAILHWDGHAFEHVPSGTHELLRGLWGGARHDIWAVGDHGTILHWLGGGWSVVPSGVQAALHAVWGTGANNVWVVGEHGTILHWQGASWTKVPSGTDERLRAIWGSRADEIWAVGTSGTILAWNGSAWSPVFSDTVEHFLSISGSGPDDVWATTDIWASYRSTIVHWNGKFWSALDRTPRTPLTAVWAFDRGSAIAVGSAGTILQFRPLER
jgi:serine/threonine protein kinase